MLFQSKVLMETIIMTATKAAMGITLMALPNTKIKIDRKMPAANVLK